MQLLETIRFENGRFNNLAYHQKRMNQSRYELLGCEDEIDLFSILQEKLPKTDARSHLSGSRFYGFLNCNQAIAFRKHIEAENKNHTDLKGLVKCRIIYSRQIEKIEFVSYQLPKIWSLKIIVDDEIEYNHKYFDRDQLDLLYRKKGNCDDILIVKNGLITDTWFANILFFNGKEWITPSKPLLKGTQRSKLLDQEAIKTADIRLDDLKYFKIARIINTMIRFEDEIEININNISV